MYLIVGFAIYQALPRTPPPPRQALQEIWLGRLEIVTRHDGDTFRAVYTVRFEAAAHVLHAFRKKARRGIATLKLVARLPASATEPAV